VGVAGGDVGLLRLGGGGALEEGEGVGGPFEGDVVEVPEVVRVPGVLGGEHQRALVGARRAAEVAEERLGQAEHRPGAVVVGAAGDHPAGEERGAPGIVLDAELGQVAVGVDPRVALGGGGAGEAGQEREDVLRVVVLAHGALHFASQAVDLAGGASGHAFRDTTSRPAWLDHTRMGHDGGP
jgi:hypothetical protein